MACDTPMEIRIATLADADALIAFDCVAEAEPSSAYYLHERVKSSTCYVAVIGGKIVAYGVLNYKFYDYGWVEMLHVDSRCRRRGIGSALMRYFANECRTTKLFTSTNQSNVPMQRLLAALGFERSGFIENLDDGDPELIYYKRLHLAD